MPNELLLILNLLIIFSSVLLFYYLFGKIGLFTWTVIATLTANIEVLLLIQAFGMEQTLGNILFASNFLVTDIISEKYGREDSNKAVNIGMSASFIFIVISQFWLFYTPADSDWAFSHIQAIFKNTPRIILASFLVYLICQKFDVWLYHKIWNFTTKKFGNAKKYLWVRNTGATLISQLLNSVLYTFGAFGGMYPIGTLVNICISTYIIYFVTSLADTPFVYAARKICPKE